MGASGSTAASCSSLDTGDPQGHQQLRHRAYRQQQHRNLQREQHEQRVSKYREQQVEARLPLASGQHHKLKQSNSYFDLTAISAHHQLDQQQFLHRHQLNSQVANQHELQGGYQSAASPPPLQSFASGKPVMVLPPSQPVAALVPVGRLIHAKKSNAGVASRILLHRQQQQHHQLKKFSDSLPSLNNMLLQPNSAPHQQVSPREQSHHQCQRNSSTSISCHLQRTSANLSSQQQVAGRLLAGAGLSRQHERRPLHKQPARSHHNQRPPPPTALRGQQLNFNMKRATSLSSLHPSNFDSGDAISSRRPRQQPPQQSAAHLMSPDVSLRPESMNSNSELRQQVAGRTKPHRFTQQAAAGGHSQQASRYKSRLSRHQQPPQNPQQGCPVLPPLPRSQSLHELVQLRATENGQRMRNTGTLRAPLAGPESSGAKVNLVAELLESRRREKEASERQPQRATAEVASPTAILSSHCCSSDDGIHDASLTGDDQHSPTGTGQLAPSGDRRRASSPRQQQPVSARAGDGRPRGDSSGGERFRQRLDLAEGRRSNGGARRSNHREQQPAQSTLKRSRSHSALHESLVIGREGSRVAAEADGDESDDLNELAKFLYQFKQRQAQNKQQREADQRRHQPQQIQSVQRRGFEPAATASGDGDKSRVAASTRLQQQQSPSSTSSSGFASSTCTSNSISSSHSDECASGRSGERLDRRTPIGASGKPAGRKKYPAPPRPDERLEAAICRSSEQAALSAASGAKCLISGKLKLSSSLLSIVDEYNNSNNNNNSTLQSVASSYSQQQRRPVGLASVLANGSEEAPRASDLHAPVDAESGDSLMDGDCQPAASNLEHLRRYTQLRQMSQSEVALNHLTSSSSAGGKSKLLRNEPSGANLSGGKQPYKSRLINLIRRISDKSADRAAAATSGDHNGVHSGQAIKNKDEYKRPQSISSSCNSNSAGGRHQQEPSGLAASAQTSAINQSRLIAANSNQSGGRGSASYVVSVGESGCVDGKSRAAMRLPMKSAPTPALTSACELGNNNHDGGANTSRKLMASEASYLSGSLCDLNFDCDLELIKNCASGNTAADSTRLAQHRAAGEHRRANGQPQPPQAQQVGSSCSLLQSAHPLLLSKSSGQLANGPQRALDADQLRQDSAGEQANDLAAIKSSKGEAGGGNWRLAPTPLSLVVQPGSSGSSLSTAATTSCLGASRSSGRDSKCRLHGGAPEDPSPSQADDRSVGGGAKLRWPAAGWLMNGGARKKQQEAMANGSSSNKGGKSRLARLISSSGTSAPEVAGKSGLGGGVAAESGREADGHDAGEMQSADSHGSRQAAADQQLTNEADQLLVELDHSLDLVSGERPLGGHHKLPPFSRRAALSWWRSTGGQQLDPRGHLVAAGLSGLLTGEADDEAAEDAYDAMSRIELQQHNCAGVQPLTSGSEDDDDGRRGGDEARWRRSRRRRRQARNLNGDDYSDEDDDDEGDYASLNRAMINEIFDVRDGISASAAANDNAERRRQPQVSTDPISSSPSHSFTFSAPSSPAPSITGEPANPSSPLRHRHTKLMHLANQANAHQQQRPQVNGHLKVNHSDQSAQQNKPNKGACLGQGKLACPPTPPAPASAIVNSSSSAASTQLAIDGTEGKANISADVNHAGACVGNSAGSSSSKPQVPGGRGDGARAEIAGGKREDNRVAASCCGSDKSSRQLAGGYEPRPTEDGNTSKHHLYHQSRRPTGEGVMQTAAPARNNNLDNGNNNKRGAGMSSAAARCSELAANRRSDGGNDYDNDHHVRAPDDDIVDRPTCCSASSSRLTCAVDCQHQCQHRRKQPIESSANLQSHGAIRCRDKSPLASQGVRCKLSGCRCTQLAAPIQGHGDDHAATRDPLGRPPTDSTSGVARHGNNQPIAICPGVASHSQRAVARCSASESTGSGVRRSDGDHRACPRDSAQICIAGKCSSHNGAAASRASEDNCNSSGECCCRSSGTGGQPIATACQLARHQSSSPVSAGLDSFPLTGGSHANNGAGGQRPRQQAINGTGDELPLSNKLIIESSGSCHCCEDKSCELNRRKEGARCVGSIAVGKSVAPPTNGADEDASTGGSNDMRLRRESRQECGLNAGGYSRQVRSRDDDRAQDKRLPTAATSPYQNRDLPQTSSIATNHADCPSGDLILDQTAAVRAAPLASKCAATCLPADGRVANLDHSKCGRKVAPRPPNVSANSICRSNSELISSGCPSKSSGEHPGGRQVVVGQQGAKRQPPNNGGGKNMLFGKLRSSLLSPSSKADSTKSPSQPLKLASSQISLVSYAAYGARQYNDATFIVKPDGVKPALDNFDDNFILRRKTPNAGLKSHC